MEKTLKPVIKEAVVVEGRDDTIAVLRACDALTIETHGFGIRAETWELIKKAYNEQGIIIFTDPDYSGEEIRKKISARFPNAKQAFLSRDDATKKGDIGIENAEPEAIISALEKAHMTVVEKNTVFTEKDLFDAGLAGGPSSSLKREKLAKKLGIGYSNVRGTLKKLNSFGITREEFYEALSAIGNQVDPG